MSNLSQQFSGGPNPALVAIKGIDKVLNIMSEKEKRKRRAAYLSSSQYKDATTLQKRYSTMTDPKFTSAPLPGYKVQQPITPESTGAPMPGELAKKTAIHPITGERVQPVPVKRRGKKPTPPGTKPKRK